MYMSVLRGYDLKAGNSNANELQVDMALDGVVVP